MPCILVVHHTVSPALAESLEAVLHGITRAGDELGVSFDARVRAALTAGPIDVLEADGIVLGTPVNIGYISGALKHFFDQIYYPCLEQSAGTPVGTYLHANSDDAGARRALDKITTGLSWPSVRDPVTIHGEVTADDRSALTDLAGLVCAHASGALS